MELQNPFLISGYTTPELFCDREKETTALVSAIKNHRNVTLFSYRRLGKTALIKHVFHKLQATKKYSCFYIDVYSTQNLTEFVNQLGTAIVGKLDSTPSKAFQNIAEIFKSFRPLLQFDELTGAPSVSFDFKNNSDLQKSIGSIFNYLQKKGKNKRIVIAIDEFQQITNYPEKNVEALLRSYIQPLNNISFVFLGSHKHLLHSMFTDVRRPFYQSTELMQLNKIGADKYGEFIKSVFAKYKRKIEPEALEKILEWGALHTFYVQFICNKLFSEQHKTYTLDHVHGVLYAILKEQELWFITNKKLLTEQQFQLIKAIAKENGIRKTFSKGFILKHKLSTAPTVARGLKALYDAELIYDDEVGYYVYDVFFAQWLKRIL